jgi:hypothetical protein
MRREKFFATSGFTFFKLRLNRCVRSFDPSFDPEALDGEALDPSTSLGVEPERGRRLDRSDRSGEVLCLQ